MGVLANYAASTEACFAHHESKRIREIESMIPSKRIDVSMDSETDKKRNALSGEERIHGFMNLVLNGMYNKPHIFQYRLIILILSSVAPILAKYDWEIIGPSVIKTYGLERVIPYALAKAGRRMGKSEGSTMCQIAISRYHPDGIKQATIATCLRIAKQIQESTLRLLEKSNLSHWIKPKSVKQESVVLYSIDGNESMINYYPCNPKVSD